VLRCSDEVVARWPRTVSLQVENATEGWSELPFSGDGCSWSLRLLQLDRLDESVIGATRLALRALDLRNELRNTRFDERFHLWELEAIRSMATGIGGILESSRLAEELISHLVALLGVRSAHLYLGDGPDNAECVGAFGAPVLAADELEQAWEQGLYGDEVVALRLQAESSTLGVLVAAHKEARAGTEPFAANDVRLLELFAIQVTVALEHSRLTRESLERERLRQELEVAAVIQSHLHPRDFPGFPGFRLAARSTPSRQVAGDTHDVLIREERLIATVADVSGKGVGAGMIASGIHAGVRLLIQGGEALPELASRINRYLTGATADNRFATFAMLQITADGDLSAVNAGHCPVLIRRRDGAVEQVLSSGLPLGILDDVEYRVATYHLEPGELVLLYTDGVSEAESPEEEEFGVDRVVEVLAALDRVDAEAACDQMLAAVRRHTRGQPLQDDATLLVVERLSEQDQ
jgi:serine phosphatase RsbU (regulator of sigma subunit)